MPYNGSPGGRAWAAIQRAAAIKRYNASPRRCEHCDAKLELPTNVRPAAFKKKFCDNSCAASHNNVGVIRNPKRPIESRECLGCERVFTPRQKGTRGHNQRYCSVRCAKSDTNVICVLAMTKAALFANRSWQSARSTIQKHARRLFLQSTDRHACDVCGYDKHFDVAHRRSVSDFPDDTTIAEINAITNLRPLCPNHHWEYDNGLLVEAGGFEPAA